MIEKMTKLTFLVTSKEYELLRILAEHRNTAMDRKYLMDQVWGYTYIGVGKSRLVQHRTGPF